MPRKGLLIDYQFCSGCQACVVACKQEHGYPVGTGGMILNEVNTVMPNGRLRIDVIPFTTEYCDLCAARTARGERPSCAKHCQAQVIEYGDVTELAKKMAEREHYVMYTPK